jgi:hypothetical protein
LCQETGRLYSPNCREGVSLLRNAVRIGVCALEESRKRQ